MMLAIQIILNIALAMLACLATAMALVAVGLIAAGTDGSFLWSGLTYETEIPILTLMTLLSLMGLYVNNGFDLEEPPMV